MARKPNAGPASVTIRGTKYASDTLVRPDALAAALKITGKQLRGHLRERYALGTPERNAMQPGGKASAWTLTRNAIAEVAKRYGGDAA